MQGSENGSRGSVNGRFAKAKKPRHFHERGFFCFLLLPDSGGDEGIRTLDTSFSPYAPLAGECLRPLGHISGLLWKFQMQRNI